MEIIPKQGRFVLITFILKMFCNIRFLSILGKFKYKDVMNKPTFPHLEYITVVLRKIQLLKLFIQ